MNDNVTRISPISHIGYPQDKLCDLSYDAFSRGKKVKGTVLGFAAGAIDGAELACLTMGAMFVGLGVYGCIKSKPSK